MTITAAREANKRKNTNEAKAHEEETKNNAAPQRLTNHLPYNRTTRDFLTATSFRGVALLFGQLRAAAARMDLQNFRISSLRLKSPPIRF